MAEKSFITADFLLQNPCAKILYHEYAKKQPIFDYHNHLSAKEIAGNRQFENITQLWIEGDHYKWRAMRANGIDEKYITGNASDYDKFIKWAETVPHTLRNPLYHWSHLELKTYFDIDDLLSPQTADGIYKKCNDLLKLPEYRVQNLLRKMNVKMLGTTDDPTDDLHDHKQIQEQKLEFAVLPSFRPDKATEIEKPEQFVTWVTQLERKVDFKITDFEGFTEALRLRHDYFHSMGCRISDHGHACFYAEKYIETEIDAIFKNGLQRKPLTVIEIDQFKSAVLYKIAKMNHKRSWTQQFHVGALRNNNSKMRQLLGPDQGFDSLGDLPMANSMRLFFDRLNSEDCLAKSIVYNLNPKDSELFAAMVANFNDGLVAGKMQYGAAWWFLDQKDGIEKQLNVLSNFGLLSRSVGMLTDSRSFLSFPRHDYFRRILCNILGDEMEKGLLPNDSALIGNLVEAICYKNAKNYFQIAV